MIMRHVNDHMMWGYHFLLTGYILKNPLKNLNPKSEMGQNFSNTEKKSVAGRAFHT